jgi:alkaline phosphatase D
MFRSFTLITACALTLSSVAQTTLPDRMFADSAYAPYLWGVASGDPTSDGVVIWAKVQESIISVIQPQTWEVSADSSFAITSATGSVDAVVNNDFCVRAVVTGLQPNTYYYYRFTDFISGNTSRIGRTKTAPEGSTENVTFAVASCSSIYSGYFNAYRNIANNDEVDLMIHLGDYIYNFVDDDEQIRIPDPFPADPENIGEWRDRHEYYLLDPDLRKARQMHPWVVIWDNHDFGNGTEGGIEAFWEYIPRRDSQNDISQINRSLAFGNLVDLIMIDIEKYRNIDTLSTGETSVLGTDQREWFLDELSNSTAKWRIVGNQKMFGGWYSEDIPPWLEIPNDGDVFDAGSWDGFMAERGIVLNHLVDNNIDNFMMLSGDVHMSFCMDVSLNPKDSLVYDPLTGNGSVGVEFIPSSISRGNFDESGIDISFQNVVETASGTMNPHHIYTNFFDHGYGILEINQDSIVAEIRFCDKLTVTDEETLGTRMLMVDGENKWHRTGSPESVSEPDKTNPISVFPNPSKDVVTISIDNRIDPSSILTILNSQGQIVKEFQPSSSEIKLGVSDLPNGTYLINLTSENGIAIKSFVIVR